LTAASATTSTSFRSNDLAHGRDAGREDVRIVTDATAHLSQEFIAQHEIAVLPVEVRLGDERFTIGSGGDARPLFERMASGPVRPAQVIVTSKAVEQVFERLHRETEDILLLLSSSKLSGIYHKVNNASRAYIGRCRITVIDTMSISRGLGLVVEAAAKAAAEHAPMDAIVRLVRGVLPHIYIVLFVERLEYLEQGRRIGPAQALLGTMLRIRPILLLEGGEIIPLEKVRTRALALDKLADFVSEFAAIRQVVIMRSPLDGDTDQMVGELKQRLGEVVALRQFPVVEYDPILACHIGPQALGVIVYEGA